MTHPETENRPDSGLPYEHRGDQEQRSGVVHPIHDDESAMEAVVRAISTETETAQEELDPLYSAVDPEALNDLFTDRHGERRQTDISVVFEYSGRQVRVGSTGTVQISSPP